MEVADVTKDLRRCKACLYQGKWARFFHWCCGNSIGPCKDTVRQMAKFTPMFVNPPQELSWLVLTVKGYRAAVLNVFILAGTVLAANRIVNRMFSSFEKNFFSREMKHQNGTCL